MNSIKQFILVLIIYTCSMAFIVKGQVTNSSDWKNKDIIIFTQDNKYGMLDYDHKTILSPIYDTIIPFQEYNLYITKKENQFGYSIKQWKKKDFEKEDTWIISDESYDSLFFSSELRILVYRQNNKYGFIDFKLYDTYQRKYKYSMGELSKTENKYDTVFFTDKNLLILRQDSLYGMINRYRDKMPPQFDTPPKTPYMKEGSSSIIVQHQNKFGILPYAYSQEQADLPFDEEPLHYKHYFYFVKKEGLWGVVNANYKTQKESDNICEIVPCDYEELTRLKTDLRHIIAIDYNPFDNNRVSDGFIGGVFTTTVGKTFVINDYIDHPSYSNRNKYFTLKPTWNGHLVIQDSTYEYLFNKIHKLNFYALLKIEREETEWRKSMGNYFIRNAAGGTSYVNGPTEPYEINKLKAVITYYRDHDSLVQLHAFEEEADSITYDILYSSGTGIYYRGSERGFGFVLKSTQLNKSKYIHEFFDYYGTLMYTVKSKYPITHWRSTGFPTYEFSNYEKRICGYNGSKSKFYK